MNIIRFFLKKTFLVFIIVNIVFLITILSSIKSLDKTGTWEQMAFDINFYIDESIPEKSNKYKTKLYFSPNKTFFCTFIELNEYSEDKCNFKTFYVWKIGQKIPLLKKEINCKEVSCLFSRDEKYLAIYEDNSCSYLFSIPQKKKLEPMIINKLNKPHNILSLFDTPCNAKINEKNNKQFTCEVNNKTITISCPNNSNDSIRDIKFSSQGNLVGVLFDNKELEVWNVSTNTISMTAENVTDFSFNYCNTIITIHFFYEYYNARGKMFEFIAKKNNQ